MHRIHYTIRRITPSELPTVPTIPRDDTEAITQRPATEAELLNMGIVALGSDLYSCIEQLRRDPDTLEWDAVGHPPIGTLLAHGDQRFHRLPEDVRPQVLLAEVITATDSGDVSAVAVAQSNIAEQEAAIAEFVGEVDGNPLVELSITDEARRLSQIPDSGIERVRIPMADVDDSAQVIEATNLIPHRWAGER